MSVTSAFIAALFIALPILVILIAGLIIWRCRVVLRRKQLMVSGPDPDTGDSPKAEENTVAIDISQDLTLCESEPRVSGQNVAVPARLTEKKEPSQGPCEVFRKDRQSEGRRHEPPIPASDPRRSVQFTSSTNDLHGGDSRADKDKNEAALKRFDSDIEVRKNREKRSETASREPRPVKSQDGSERPRRQRTPEQTGEHESRRVHRNDSKDLGGPPQSSNAASEIAPDRRSPSRR